MVAKIGDEQPKVKYFIGDDKCSGEINIYFKSNDDINNVLNQSGKSLNSVIYEDNPIGGVKPIYKWTGDRWRKI